MNFYINYIFENVKIMLKRLIEYKSNFYSAFFEQIFYLSTFFIFVLVLNQNFDEIITWSSVLIFTFILIEDTLRTTAGIFAWKSDFLTEIILKGELNNLLVRPGELLFKYHFSDLSPSSLTYVIVNVPILIILIMSFQMNLLNCIFLLILFLFCILIYFSLYNLIYSIAFFYKNFEKNLTNLLYRTNSLFVLYPAPFFNKFKLVNLFFLFPAYIIGKLIIPLLNDINIDYFFYLDLFLIFFLIILILNILIYFNWKIGLKKYEAYG